MHWLQQDQSFSLSSDLPWGDTMQQSSDFSSSDISDQIHAFLCLHIIWLSKVSVCCTQRPACVSVRTADSGAKCTNQLFWGYYTTTVVNIDIWNFINETSVRVVFWTNDLYCINMHPSVHQETTHMNEKGVVCVYTWSHTEMQSVRQHAHIILSSLTRGRKVHRLELNLTAEWPPLRKNGNVG